MGKINAFMESGISDTIRRLESDLENLIEEKDDEISALKQRLADAPRIAAEAIMKKYAVGLFNLGEDSGLPLVNEIPLGYDDNPFEFIKSSTTCLETTIRVALNAPENCSFEKADEPCSICEKTGKGGR